MTTLTAQMGGWIRVADVPVVRCAMDFDSFYRADYWWLVGLAIEVVDLGTGAVVAEALNPLTTSENPHRPNGRFSPDGTMLATNNRIGDIAYFAVEPEPEAITVSEETKREFLYTAWSSDSRAP